MTGTDDAVAEPSIGAKLTEQARRVGGRPFVTLPDGTLTYAEADALGDRFAAALAGLGYAEGDVVAVLCGTGIPLLAAWFACARLGAVFMPVLPAFMRPRYIEVRPALPKTASSRVRKFLLSEEGVAASWERPPRL